MVRNVLLLPASLLALVAPVLALLPYNPTRIISTSNGSAAYLFFPQPSSSQFTLSLLDTSNQVNSTSSSKTLFADLPFLSSSTSKAFIPLVDDGGMTVLAGDCQKSARGIELWRLTKRADDMNGTWSALQVVLNDASFSADYLSAGFTFSPTASTDNTSVYVFGGMCPETTSTNAATWVSDATYSNTMLTLSAASVSAANAPYQLSITGSRAPPIAEAGLTMTPLPPSFSNISTANMSQQQNFVLLGGHTQNAFINMSQVALFSLPQESWAFIGVDQPAIGGSTELMPRDVTTVEPRSGHTAVLTEDGSKIIVLGGWVGDISTPAQPQLAILEIGEGYGGVGNWAWNIPTQKSNPFGAGQGMYGHGAAMLPGGVMMISGGHGIAKYASKFKRQSSGDFLFFNVTSMSWIDSYVNPSSPSSPAYSPSVSSSTGLNRSEKVGLGAGLGLGLAAAAGIAIFWFLYSSRMRQRRAIREKELRELALGAERYHSPSISDEDQRYHGARTASWHNMQERQIESSGDYPYPWAPVTDHDQPIRMRIEGEDNEGNGLRQAERTGLLMEIPSPTRGLRRSLHSRGPQGFGAHFQGAPGGAPGSVFRIDEEEEGSQGGSLKRSKTPKATLDRSPLHSDPFKDPPPTLDPAQDEAAQKRKREVQGWVEDWASAAESMALSRNPSQAQSRTYSSLSQAYSQSNSHSGGSNSDPSGRGSPDKSDRTGSNLSDRSVYSQASIQRSMTGTLSRNISQRSASAGYALFSGAAAAMSRLAGSGSRPAPQSDYGTTTNITRAPSNRSVSLNMNSTSTGGPRMRERAETFSTARTSIGPIQPGEDQTLLFGPSSARTHEADYWTPPESPVKDRGESKYSRAGSLTRTGVKAMGLLGSVKRVFTGTGSVDVQDRVAGFETRSGQSSPTKHSGQPEMAETTPRRTVSAGQAFWRGKRGAKDWDAEEAERIATGKTEESTTGTGTVRRKPVPGNRVVSDDFEGLDSEDEDWDVETAIQKRVVQVMFTVPKEKLRVVNADALSLLSSNRSEVDHEEERDRDKDVKRMSSVRERDEVEIEGLGDDPADGKEKGVIRD